MTWQSPALVWARSIADRHTTRTVGVPRLDLVQVRPAAASQWHTTNVTRHDELRLAPRLAITVHTHLERAHTSAPRASSLVDRVYARADRVVPPVGRMEPDVIGGRPGPERVHARPGTATLDAPPEPVRRTVGQAGLFERVDRVVRARAVANQDPSSGTARPSAPRPASLPVESEAGWPPAAPRTRSVHPAAGDAPVIDIEHVTDQVVRAIDRRALAYRERRGRI